MWVEVNTKIMCTAEKTVLQAENMSSVSKTGHAKRGCIACSLQTLGSQ